MPGDITAPAFIDKVEVRKSNAHPEKELLSIQIFARVFVTLPSNSPLLTELEACLGEKIDFADEAQLAGLKGKHIRVNLHERSTDFGDLITVTDFRPVLPVSEKA